jgi:hypothetical protein
VALAPPERSRRLEALALEDAALAREVAGLLELNPYLVMEQDGTVFVTGRPRMEARAAARAGGAVAVMKFAP